MCSARPTRFSSASHRQLHTSTTHAQASLRTLAASRRTTHAAGATFAELINQTSPIRQRTTLTTSPRHRVSIYLRHQTHRVGQPRRLVRPRTAMGSKQTKLVSIQVPRVYKVFRANKHYLVLWQYSREHLQAAVGTSPRMGAPPYRRLHNFLAHVSGFDSVTTKRPCDPALLGPSVPRGMERPSRNPPYNSSM